MNRQAYCWNVFARNVANSITTATVRAGRRSGRNGNVLQATDAQGELFRYEAIPQLALPGSALQSHNSGHQRDMNKRKLAQILVIGLFRDIYRTFVRTYEKTHPWITFTLDLRPASPFFWILLGEARSKCEHIANVPLRPTTAEQLHRLYLAKGVLATTAIEGNTLSEEEVLKHLEGKLRLPSSKEYLTREIDNIVTACNRISIDLRSGHPPVLSVKTITEFNRLVLENLTLGEGVTPGTIRTHSVGVARYRGAPAEDCEYLLERLCTWLGGSDFEPPPNMPEMALVYAILKAIVAHLYLAWIHPFGDGNGRTARLVEFLLLVTSGVPGPAAHLLSNHYNQTRVEYYRQLDQASQSGGDVLPFLTYAVQGFVDGLRSQLEVIREQQWDVAWENYIHERFQHSTSPNEVRRRHLLLDLSERAEPIPFGKLRELSPRVATAYATKTDKTLSRDLKALIEMGLLEATATGYRPARETILAFLPLQRTGETQQNMDATPEIAPPTRGRNKTHP